MMLVHQGKHVRKSRFMQNKGNSKIKYANITIEIHIQTSHHIHDCNFIKAQRSTSPEFIARDNTTWVYDITWLYDVVLINLLVSWRSIFVVEENETEDEQTSEHWERARVVRIRRRDETLVLCVVEGTHWHLTMNSYLINFLKYN